MKRPNLLFIMTDHQLNYRHGWDMGPAIQHPHFDRLAREGVNFTRAYSANPLCGPTRRSMLTGQYSHRHGEVLNDVNVPMEHDSYLQILGDGGYRNYYFGKWHAGPGTARDHGCEGYCHPSYGNPYLTEEYQSYLSRKGLPSPEVLVECTMDPWRLDLQPGKRYVQDKEWSNEQAAGILLTPKETHEAFFLADLVCGQLEELAQSGGNQPFSIRMDPWGPHAPYFVTQEYADRYDPALIPEYPTFGSPLADKPRCYRREHNLGICDDEQNLVYPNPLPWSQWQLLLSRAYAHITMVDDAVGRVLDKLEQLGLARDTLVIWTVDHGDALACQGGKFDKASYMVEEVLRVPLAMRWPERVPPGQVSDALVLNFDAPVTLLEAAGLSFPYRPDGQSLLKLSEGGFRTRRPFVVSETYGHLHRNVAKTLITQRYKYTHNLQDIPELYDLATDPYETRNLAMDRCCWSMRQEMEATLREWVEDRGDNFYHGTREEVLQHFLDRGTSKPRDY